MRSEAARTPSPRFGLAFLAMPLAALVTACAPASSDRDGREAASESEAGEAEQSIMNGAADTEHPAVVWLYSDDVGSACTGTIVAVNGSTGYVLTAAHCADMSVVAITTDFRDCFDEPPGPACQGLFTVDEQVYHPSWTGELEGGDFSMIRFLGASPSTPVIPAASSGDGVARGAEVEIVGFGQTESGDNALRNHKVTEITEVDGGLFSHPQTVCYGDSGGPAIIDGHVVGVSSFVDSTDCYGHGYSGRVQDVYDDFVGPYIEQDPIVPSCEQCLEIAVRTLGGPCGAELDACRADAECSAIDVCKASCVGNPGCELDCVLSHPAGAALSDAIFRCVSCDVCIDACGEDPRCAEPPPTGATTSASTGTPVQGSVASGAGGAGDGGGDASDGDEAADDDGCTVAGPGAGDSPATAPGIAVSLLGLLAVTRRRRTQTRNDRAAHGRTQP